LGFGTLAGISWHGLDAAAGWTGNCDLLD